MKYNQIVKVRPRIELRGWKPKAVRYEATFYNSGYGMGWVVALTERACRRKYVRLRNEMMAS